MIKLGFILLFSFTLLTSCFAEAPPLILEEEKNFYKLGHNLDLLEDPKGEFSIEDLENPTFANKFKRNLMKSLNFGFSTSTFWARVKIHNKSLKNRQWILAHHYVLQDEVTLFKRVEGEWRSIVSGDLYPFSNRKLKARSFAFKISPGENSVYFIRVRGTVSRMDLTLSSYSQFFERETESNYFWGFYFGFVAIMVLYNAFIYLITKSISYIWYVLYIFFYGFLVIGLQGFGMRFLYPNIPWFSNNGISLMAALTVLFMSIFSIEFLKLKDISPKFYRVLITICITSLFLALSSFIFPYSWSIRLVNINSLVGTIFILWAGITCLKLNFRPAKYFVFAFGIQLSGTLIMLLSLSGVVVSHFLTTNAGTIGHALEILILSLALVERFNFQSDKNLKKEKELTSQLAETKVDLVQKNAELSELNRTLRIKALQEQDDLKEQKRLCGLLEDSKNQLEEKVAKRTSELTRVQEDRSLFFAKLSHELRTPLNTILGFSDILLDMVNDEHETPQGSIWNKGLKKVQNEYLTCIKSSGKSLLSLVSETLDLTKIDLNELKVVKATLNLKAFIRNTSTFYFHQCLEKDISFKTKIDESLPDCIYSDELRLKQILNNILENSIKFTNKGEVSLEFKCYFKDDSKSIMDLHIIIKDTGIGIKKEKLENLFQSFSQLHEESSVKERGTGLGLFISKKLVEALNGMIKIDSTYGKGTQFTLFFKEIEIVKDDYKEDKKNSIFKFFGDTILIGDDLPANLALIEAYLSNYDLKIFKAENSEELVKKALTFKPSLIVTDYNMPKGDGQTIYGKMKEREETKDIPIVILTALNLDESIKEKFQMVLSKPVGRQQFIEEISKFLKHEEQEKNSNEKKSEESNLFIFPDNLEKNDLEILSKMKTVFEQSLELQNITNLENFIGELKKEIMTSKLKEIDPWLDQILIESGSFQLDHLNDHLKMALKKINKFLASKKKSS